MGEGLSVSYQVSLLPQGGDLGPCAQYVPRSEGRVKITGVVQWLRAWSVFLEIFSTFFPHLTLRLIRYQGIIVRFSDMFQDSAWLMYDRLFRQKVALNNNIGWDKEDDRLYCEVLRGWEKVVGGPGRGLVIAHGDAPKCFRCSGFGHLARDCPKGGVVGAGLDGVCRDWNNKGKCLYEGRCKFRHACGHCSGAHPRVHCSRNKTR